MKRSLLLTAAMAVLLVGCQKVETGSSAASVEAYAPAPRAADAQMAAAPRDQATSKAAEALVARPLPVSAPMLAYRYEYAIETPAQALRGLIKTHEAACAAAGPAVCQMVGQSVRNEGKDRLAGELSLRATPAWLAKFRAGLDGQAKAAGGRVINDTTESEDLTRDIVDTEAVIRAKTTLRDRLQTILASRPGKLSELLEVERELARVQQEIDATQSALAVMKTRVATSAVTIHYASQGVLAAEGVWSPLGRAFSDVLAILVGTLAAMVRFVALMAPWVLLIAGLAWLFRRRLRWPGRKAKGPPPAA